MIARDGADVWRAGQLHHDVQIVAQIFEHALRTQTAAERQPVQHRPSARHDAESFDDLDEGYRPVGFWERLTGRGKPGKPDQTGKPSKKPR